MSAEQGLKGGKTAYFAHVDLTQGDLAHVDLTQAVKLCGQPGLQANATHLQLAYRVHRILVAAAPGGKRQVFELSFHSLRHTAVSLLKDAGVPDAVVMALVGHESAAISQRYTHVGRDALQRAANSLPLL